jgi:DNA-binding response OmpR family regulator
VNDDPNALELLVRVLRSAPQGWSVEQARDQLALMDRLVDSRIDVVVIDITAGGIGGGLKLLDGVRNSNDPELAATPVVLVSASASSAMFSWQAGVDELLVRPFHARDLVAAVAAAMERPAEERPRYRRQQLNLVRSGGRRLSP